MKIITIRRKGTISSWVYAMDSEIFCCDEMKTAWGEYAIGFGEYAVDRLFNCDPCVNIYRCYPYPEGAVWDMYPIQFCPFCSQKIEITYEEQS